MDKEKVVLVPIAREIAELFINPEKMMPDDELDRQIKKTFRELAQNQTGGGE